jgi:hypothetical protein
MIVASFGRYLPRTGHDHGSARSGQQDDLPAVAPAAEGGLAHRNEGGRGLAGQAVRDGDRSAERQSTAEEYALLVGPVFARLFFDRAEVTGAFIETVVNQWLAALEPRYDHCE